MIYMKEEEAKLQQQMIKTDLLFTSLLYPSLLLLSFQCLLRIQVLEVFHETSFWTLERHQAKYLLCNERLLTLSTRKCETLSGWFSNTVHQQCRNAADEDVHHCINTTSGIFGEKMGLKCFAYHWDAGVHTVRFLVGYDRSKHQCQRNPRRFQSKVHHLEENKDTMEILSRCHKKSEMKEKVLIVQLRRSKVLSILQIFSLMNCLASQRGASGVLPWKMLCQVFLKGRLLLLHGKPELILIYTNEKNFYRSQKNGILLCFACI